MAESTLRVHADAPIADASKMLAAGRLTVERVHIDSLDSDIFVRQMNGDEFWKFATLGKVGDKEASYSTRQSCVAICLSVCDEGGKRLFADEDEGADKLCTSWTFQQITEVFQAVANVNGLSEQANEVVQKKS